MLFTCLFIYSIAMDAQVQLPSFTITTDIIYDAELIPTIGAEHFFLNNDKLRSWHIDVGYQTHYNDQFGIIFNRGDNLTIGVYQGPVTKIGYTWFTRWRKKKWYNYFSPTMGLKYLWYSPLKLFTDPNILNSANDVQSEKCIELVPQAYFGQKRFWGSFCFDYYFGFQVPIKFRDKTIISQADNYGNVNPNVPYTVYQVSPCIDLVFGIKLGYIKKTKLAVEKEDPIEIDVETK